MVSAADGTGTATSRADARGLDPAEDYESHLHVGTTCGGFEGHYRDDLDGAGTPPNELWPTNADWTAGSGDPDRGRGRRHLLRDGHGRVGAAHRGRHPRPAPRGRDRRLRRPRPDRPRHRGARRHGRRRGHLVHLHGGRRGRTAYDGPFAIAEPGNHWWPTRPPTRRATRRPAVVRGRRPGGDEPGEPASRGEADGQHDHGTCRGQRSRQLVHLAGDRHPRGCRRRGEARRRVPHRQRCLDGVHRAVPGRRRRGHPGPGPGDRRGRHDLGDRDATIKMDATAPTVAVEGIADGAKLDVAAVRTARVTARTRRPGVAEQVVRLDGKVVSRRSASTPCRCAPASTTSRSPCPTRPATSVADRHFRVGVGSYGGGKKAHQAARRRGHRRREARREAKKELKVREARRTAQGRAPGPPGAQEVRASSRRGWRTRRRSSLSSAWRGR